MWFTYIHYTSLSGLFIVFTVLWEEQAYLKLIKYNLSMFSCKHRVLGSILRSLCLVSAHKNILLFCKSFVFSFYIYFYCLFWVSIYKRYEICVEAYFYTYEWLKVPKAFLKIIFSPVNCFHTFVKEKKPSGKVVQVVERLSSKHEALSSNSNTTKKNF
jgi:hypothetical protein